MYCNISTAHIPTIISRDTSTITKSYKQQNCKYAHSKITATLGTLTTLFYISMLKLPENTTDNNQKQKRNIEDGQLVHRSPTKAAGHNNNHIQYSELCQRFFRYFSKLYFKDQASLKTKNLNNIHTRLFIQCTDQTSYILLLLKL